MYVLGVFDVHLLMVERCGVLIGVGVFTAMVGMLHVNSLKNNIFHIDRRSPGYT
jgi:hypothetical protein